MKKIGDRVRQNEDFLEKNPIQAVEKGPLPEIRKRRVASELAEKEDNMSDASSQVRPE